MIKIRLFYVQLRRVTVAWFLTSSLFTSCSEEDMEIENEGIKAEDPTNEPLGVAFTRTAGPIRYIDFEDAVLNTSSSNSGDWTLTDNEIMYGHAASKYPGTGLEKPILSTDQSRKGNTSIREKWVSVTGHQRSEWFVVGSYPADTGASGGVLTLGTTKYLGFSFRAEYAQWPRLLHQVKQKKLDKSRGPFINFGGSQFIAKSVGKKNTLPMPDPEFGVWYDVVIGWKWNPEAAEGWAYCWIKKASETTYAQYGWDNIKVGYTDHKYELLNVKIGYYQAKGASEPGGDGLIYFDEVRYGDTFEDVEVPNDVIPVAGVSVSPTSLSLQPGQTGDLKETVSPANATNKDVSWSSDNPSVVTVNSNGLVTAVSDGNAVITVTTSDGGHTATCDVTVSSATFTEIIYDDFENGWGNWNDGGPDAYRYTGGTHAHQGSAAAAIQDNTNSSVITTNNLGVAGKDQLKVDFWYKAVSLEPGEDFWLQLSTDGGNNYTTVKSWIQGTDFQNDTFYAGSVIIDGFNLNNQTRIRFRCDATGDKDDVYIDEISVLTR